MAAKSHVWLSGRNISCNRHIKRSSLMGSICSSLSSLHFPPPRGINFFGINNEIRIKAFTFNDHFPIYLGMILGPCLKNYGIPARRTIFEIWSNRAATMLASLCFRRQILKTTSALFVKFRFTSVAAQKRLASLNRKKGDEEQAQVVVYSFKIEGEAAAVRAYPRLTV